MGIADASLSATLAIATDAIITSDDGSRIVEFDRGVEETFGYRADEVLGTPLERLIPDRFRGAPRGHVTEVAASAHQVRRKADRCAVLALGGDGREFPIEALIAKVDTPTARLRAVVLRDVSALHRAAAEAVPGLAEAAVRALRAALGVRSQSEVVG